MKQSLIVFILIHSVSLSWALSQNEDPGKGLQESDPIEEVFQLAGIPTISDREESVDYLINSQVRFVSSPSQIMRKQRGKIEAALPGVSMDAKETSESELTTVDSLYAHSQNLSQIEIQDPDSFGKTLLGNYIHTDKN